MVGSASKAMAEPRRQLSMPDGRATAPSALGSNYPRMSRVASLEVTLPAVPLDEGGPGYVSDVTDVRASQARISRQLWCFHVGQPNPSVQ